MNGVLIFKVPPARYLKTPEGKNVHTVNARNDAVIELLGLTLIGVCQVIILVDNHKYYVYKNKITGGTFRGGIDTRLLPKFIEELENAS